MCGAPERKRFEEFAAQPSGLVELCLKLSRLRTGLSCNNGMRDYSEKRMIFFSLVFVTLVVLNKIK